MARVWLAILSINLNAPQLPYIFNKFAMQFSTKYNIDDFSRAKIDGVIEGEVKAPKSANFPQW